MQLITDFRDYYDHAFDREGREFYRTSRNNMSRPDMLAFMESKGLLVPRYGLAKDLVPRMMTEDFPDWDQETLQAASLHLIDVIVFTDLFAHRGEGKIRMSAGLAQLSYPNNFAVEYIPPTKTGLGVSFRYLQVGNRRWWLQYWSNQDWRSNIGDGEVLVLGEEQPGYDPRFKYPMWAIDFIFAGHKQYAIDFNTAPGLKPLREAVTPSEVVNLLKLARAEGYWEGQERC